MPAEKLIPDSVVLRLFVIVTIFAAVVLPTASLPKASVVGESVTWATPVPVRLTDCGEFEAWSVIMIDPVRVPMAVGVNVTLIVQLAAAPSGLPHPLV